MLKYGIVFLFYLLVIFGIFYQGSRLFLAYFVLFPMLLFPLFYFYHSMNQWLFFTAGTLFALFYAFIMFQQHSLEFSFLGLGSTVVLGCLIAYQRFWRNTVKQETQRKELIQQELWILKGKYDTRLESLHRLEKQVSSLMELFEIVRDFSESLSFQSMAKLLREKVMPVLPFSRMRFILISKSEGGLQFNRQFMITASGWEEIVYEFSEHDLECFKKVAETKQMMKLNEETAESPPVLDSGVEWIFPLVIDGEAAALLTVEGAHSDDFVRFEVLTAQLVLQVKKIKLYETVKELSIIDDLTRVYVRRHFLERFSEELERSIKYRFPFAVLMLDIDHFKLYNDQFGHLVGDATLREVARLLRENLRKVDIVARYGGEEFVAVLPETTAEAAGEVAERIRSNIARHRFSVYDVETQVTVSLGIALFPADIPENKINARDPDVGPALIRYADKALYRAKEEGRNRVYRYQDL